MYKLRWLLVPALGVNSYAHGLVSAWFATQDGMGPYADFCATVSVISALTTVITVVVIAASASEAGGRS